MAPGAGSGLRLAGLNITCGLDAADPEYRGNYHTQQHSFHCLLLFERLPWPRYQI
jgi:hypothetical protein